MVLPDPMRPMIPTRSPGAILNDTFSSAFICALGYLNVTFSNEKLPLSMVRAINVRSGGRSRSSDITALIAVSAVMLWLARVIMAAMPASGPRMRPASIVAATSAPTDSLPSMIRKTPTTTINSVVNCCAVFALFSASDDQK